MAQIDDDNVYFSFLNGARYSFRIEDYSIVYWASAWTGMEKVTIDGKTVSEFRSFSKNTEHKFTHNNSNYKISYGIKNLLKGNFKCSLYKDGAFVRAYAVHFPKSNKFINISSIIIFVSFLAYLIIFNDETVFYAYLIVLLCCFVLMLYDKLYFKKRAVEYEIEE